MDGIASAARPTPALGAALITVILLAAGCGGGGGSAPGGREAPIVNVGADQSVQEGATVTLTGTASGGSGDLSLQWTQTAGPQVALVTNGTTATFTAPAFDSDNTLIFQLRATDPRGGTATDSTAISVRPRIEAFSASNGFAYTGQFQLDDALDFHELTIGLDTRFLITLRTLDNSAATLAVFQDDTYSEEILLDQIGELAGNSTLIVEPTDPRTLFLRVSAASGTPYTITGIRTSAAVSAGFPVDVPSPGPEEDAIPIGPGTRALATGNLDADAAPEIVFAAGRQLFVANLDGSLLTGWPQPIADGEPLFSLGQFDTDPALEIALGSVGDRTAPCTGTRTVLNGDGTAVAGWPTTGCAVNAPPAIADLDGDGLDEVFFDDATGFAADGTPLPAWTTSRPTYGQPGIADVDGDGALDLVFSVDNDLNDVIAVDALGNVLAGFPVQEAARGDTDARRTGPIGLPDFDQDGAHELIRIRAITVGRNERLLVELYDSDGTRFWRQETETSVTGTIVPAFADMNGDGNPELLLQTDSELYVWERSGALLTGFPFALATGNALTGTGAASPLIADVRPDTPEPEVIVAMPNEVKVVSAAGTLVDVIPFPDNALTGAITGTATTGSHLALAAQTRHAATGEPAATLWLFDLGPEATRQWSHMGGCAKRQFRRCD